MKRAERTRLFYQSLPGPSRALLDAAIFCLFAPIGVATHILLLGDRSWLVLALLVFMSGGIAILYARAGFTGRYVPYIAAGLTVQALLIWLARSLQPMAGQRETLDAAALQQLRDGLETDVALLIGLIALGYGLFVSLFTREGARYLATSTEIRLARRIHQRLVPAITGRNRDVEWAGVSVPSGDIGGDLVDVVEGPGGIVGCVADVSGHGVGAGLLMGMFKTAFRASVVRFSDPAELLADIHVALSPLTEPNMFATAAVVRVAGGTLQFAGAGHPPLLIYRAAAGRVEQVASTGPAIALLDDFSCSSVETAFARGDIALLVTDGILEALDASNREVGIDRVIEIMAGHATAPLSALLAGVAALATAGSRVDDQTVLVVRAL